MDNAEHEPTHRPLPGTSIQPLGYLIGLQFHPPIKLAQSKGLEFAAKLSTAVNCATRA